MKIKISGSDHAVRILKSLVKQGKKRIKGKKSMSRCFWLTALVDVAKVLLETWENTPTDTLGFGHKQSLGLTVFYVAETVAPHMENAGMKVPK